MSIELNNHMEPADDEPDYTCPDCDGSGAIDVGSGELQICPNCKGHGSIEGKIADEEVERQQAHMEDWTDDN